MAKKNNNTNNQIIINTKDSFEKIWEKIKDEKYKFFKKRFVFSEEKNYITDPARKRQVAITMTEKNLRLSMYLLIFSFCLFLGATFFAINQKNPNVYGVKLNGDFYELDTKSAKEVKNEKAYKIKSSDVSSRVGE